MFLVQVNLVRQNEQGGTDRVTERKLFKGDTRLDEVKEWVVDKTQNPNIILRDLLINEPEMDNNVIPIVPQ